MILESNGLAFQLTILLFLSFFGNSFVFYLKSHFFIALVFFKSILDLLHFKKPEIINRYHLFFPKIFTSHLCFYFLFPKCLRFLNFCLHLLYFYFYNSFRFDFKIEIVDWEDQALHFYYNPFFKYNNIF